MPAHDLCQGAGQGGGVEVPGEANGGGDVVGGAAGLPAVEEPEPLLRRGERHGSAAGSADERRGRCAVAAQQLLDGCRRQVGEHRAFEDLAQRELDAEGAAHRGGKLGGEQGVAAAGEEVVTRADPRDAEQRLMSSASSSETAPAGAAGSAGVSGRKRASSWRSTLPLGESGMDGRATI